MRPYVHFKAYQKVLSILLVISLLVPFATLTFPKKAEAVCTPYKVQLPPNPLAVLTDGSLDPNNLMQQAEKSTEFFKTCVLNGLATVIAKQIIKQLTASIVTWINSGFKGNPSFVQNSGSFFGGIADKVAGNVIENVAPFLCSPFRLNIQLALAMSQTASSQDELSCTLTDVENNIKDFANGTGGGWSNWFEITQTPQNNPYGAMMLAQAQLKASVESAQGKYTQQLSWGKGFLSFEECPPDGGSAQRTENAINLQEIQQRESAERDAFDIGPASYNEPTKSYATQNSASLASVGSLGSLSEIFKNIKNKDVVAAVGNTSDTTQKSNFNLWDNGMKPLTSSATHTNYDPLYNPTDRRVFDANNEPVYGVEAGNNGCQTKTPGAVVESQLSSMLGSDLRGLEIAQSIDQIFSALVGQLVSQVMGGIGGLAGAGSKSSSGSSSSGFDYEGLLGNGVDPNAPPGSVVIPNLPLAGACVPSKQNLVIGEEVVWNVYVPDINGSVKYTWYGDENLTGSSASLSKTYTTNGTKIASVIVSNSETGGQSIQIDCTPSVVVGNINTGTSPTISCTASKDTVEKNNPVTWQAVVVGGTPPFTFAWQGDGDLSGKGQTVTARYRSAGLKTATVYVTGADGNTYSNTCRNTVEVKP